MIFLIFVWHRYNLYCVLLRIHSKFEISEQLPAKCIEGGYIPAVYNCFVLSMPESNLILIVTIRTEQYLLQMAARHQLDITTTVAYLVLNEFTTNVFVFWLIDCV